MPRTKFKKLIKNRIETKALEYLQTKRGSKGKQIRHTTLKMSEFLRPFNSSLNIEEKRKLFEKRNRMTVIPYHFGQKEEKRICGEIEDMQHIFYLTTYAFFFLLTKIIRNCRHSISFFEQFSF